MVEGVGGPGKGNRIMNEIKSFSETISTGSEIDQDIQQGQFQALGTEPVYELPGLERIIGQKSSLIPRSYLPKSKIEKLQKLFGVSVDEIRNAVRKAAAGNFLTQKEGLVLREMLGLFPYEKISHLVKAETETKLSE